MALSPYSGPRIRIRANVRIPARVSSGPGISQEIANGVLTTGLDLESLDPVVSIPDPSLYRLFVYNESTEEWETTTLDNLPTTTTGDNYTGRGDANYVILSTDRYIELTTALTAPRAWTLPAATTYPAGTRITIQDEVGGVTSTNTITINRTGADTINGASTYVMATTRGGVELRTNGVDSWSVRVIEDAAVTTAKIADTAVTTAKLATNAVTTVKVTDGNITNAKLANMAEATFKMRAAGAGTGVPIDGTGAQARAAAGAPAFARSTAVTLTTQTSVDFTSIPAGTFRIDITFAALSTNGTSLPIIQIGDSGGIETTSYSGSHSNTTVSPAVSNLSSGFALSQSFAATAVIQGMVTLVLHDALNTWVAMGAAGGSNAAFTTAVAGFKTLSAELDRVRLTTVGGTDQFDAGSVNITYYYP